MEADTIALVCDAASRTASQIVKRVEENGGELTLTWDEQPGPTDAHRRCAQASIRRGAEAGRGTAELFNACFVIKYDLEIERRRPETVDEDELQTCSRQSDSLEKSANLTSYDVYTTLCSIQSDTMAASEHENVSSDRCHLEMETMQNDLDHLSAKLDWM
jgi:hypothetical protein